MLEKAKKRCLKAIDTVLLKRREDITPGNLNSVYDLFKRYAKFKHLCYDAPNRYNLLQHYSLEFVNEVDSIRRRAAYLSAGVMLPSYAHEHLVHLLKHMQALVEEREVEEVLVSPKNFVSQLSLFEKRNSRYLRSFYLAASSAEKYFFELNDSFVNTILTRIALESFIRSLDLEAKYIEGDKRRSKGLKSRCPGQEKMKTPKITRDQIALGKTIKEFIKHHEKISPHLEVSLLYEIENCIYRGNNNAHYARDVANYSALHNISVLFAAQETMQKHVADIERAAKLAERSKIIAGSDE